MEESAQIVWWCTVMSEINIVESLIQYGIAGLALWMMYDISHNHLRGIENTLIEIKEILKDAS